MHSCFNYPGHFAGAKEMLCLNLQVVDGSCLRVRKDRALAEPSVDDKSYGRET